MAKTAAGSFSNYSGIDRHKAMQAVDAQGNKVIPDAVARQDPSVREAVRDTNPWALGLAERGATASGRSYMDPGRQAERMVRGTGSPGQFQGAQQAQQAAGQADPVEAIRRRAFGPRNRGILNQGPMAGFDVIPNQVPQTVANPGAATDAVAQPLNIAPPPNIFTNPSTSPPSTLQSRASIGAALSGGAITGFNPAQARIPVRYY